MKEVTNRKYIECPKCKSTHAEVKRSGLFAKIGIGGGLIASLAASVGVSASVFSALTFGLIGISFFILPAIIAFLIIFIPIILIINYFSGYTIECRDCHSIYKINSKEFADINSPKIYNDIEVESVNFNSHDRAKVLAITGGIILVLLIVLI